MSPRMRHYIKVSPFILAVFLAFDEVTLPVFTLLVLGVFLLFVPVRCPACGKRVDYNPGKVFLDQWVYTVCVPRKYSRCRHPLSNWADSIVP